MQGFGSVCERQKIPLSWQAGNRARGTGTAEAPGVEQESLVRGETTRQADVGVMEPGQKAGTVQEMLLRECQQDTTAPTASQGPQHLPAAQNPLHQITARPAAQDLLPEDNSKHQGLPQA